MEGTKEFLSPRELEYVQGLHDEKYYQFRANLRMRVRKKLENLAKVLPDILGNERLNMDKDEFDWDAITKPVEEFLNAHR